MGMYALYFLVPTGQQQQMYLLDRSSAFGKVFKLSKRALGLVLVWTLSRSIL
jgi:hypothetical protein